MKIKIMELTDLQLNRNLYKTQPQTLETLGASDVASNTSPAPSTAVASGNTVFDINSNSVVLNGSNFDIANLGWTQTCVFTSASLNTVTWTAGTFTSSAGTVYNISSGTTGVMAAITYIYLDTNVSTTAYQITTSQANIIGSGRVLVAVAQNGATAATFNLVETALITANNIFVNSLSAISANLGNITAGSININNKAMIDSSGQSTFVATRLLNQYTAGENVTVGKLLCFKNTFAAWGDYSGASRNTTALMSKMTYVYANSPATNFGSTNLCFQGQDGGNHPYVTLLQLDFTSNPPGIPVWNEIDTVNLRLYVVFAAGATLGGLTLSRITSAWSEGTVTYNTIPTDDGVSWSSGAVVVESFSTETNASTADGTTTGYIDFDITEIYRLWSQGTYTNLGFKISNGGAGTVACQFGGRTRTGGGTFNQAPFIVSYITKDNPGSGNTIVANDGKVYTASNASYQRVKQIAGVCGGTVSSGATCDVYSLADGLTIPSSVLTVTNNIYYFLIDSSGTIGQLTNNILESGKWDFQVGIGSPNGLTVDKDKRPLYIRQNRFAVSLPPPNCTQVFMQWNATDVNGATWSGQLVVSKGFLQSAISGGGYATGPNVNGGLVWNSGTAGTVNAAINNAGGSNNLFILYFYK